MSNDRFIHTHSLVYQRDDCIGSGASSVVYTAINKVSGETLAAKVLKDDSRYNEQDLRREIKALTQLNHENIIRFHGVEYELHSGRKVVILQYCQNSLHGFLQEPEHCHGLPDGELLILFRDLCSAISYLRSKGIIHRDVKPGNILRYTAFDLRPVYVLSDFGTSRNLEEDGAYYSLVGTEEYLHPAVYEKAFVDRSAKIAFNSGTELWSIGCTLYQAITCQMPFQPFDGARNNRMAMYEMVSCKTTGAISGYQEEAGGEIKWMTDFPKGCKSSRHLQEILKYVISDLLEADPKAQLTYTALFNRQKELDARFILNVIQTNIGTDFTLYLPQNSSLPELKEEIARFTDVHAGDQTLYYEDVILAKAVILGRKLNELFLPGVINYITAEFKNSLYEHLEPYKLGVFPVFNASNTIITDYDQTITRRRIICDIAELIDQSITFQQLTARSLVTMWAMMKTFILKVEKNFECFTVKVESYRLICGVEIGMESISIKHSKNYSQTKNRGCSGNDMVFTKLEENLGRVSEIIKCVKYKADVHFKNLELPQEACRTCLKKAETYGEQIKTILIRMKQRKKQEELLEGETFQHKKDKNDAEEICASCLSLWQDHCWKGKQKHHSNFISSKRVFHECHDQVISANKVLIEIRKQCDDVKYRISKVERHKEGRPTPALFRAYNGVSGYSFINGASANELPQS